MNLDRICGNLLSQMRLESDIYPGSTTSTPIVDHPQNVLPFCLKPLFLFRSLVNNQLRNRLESEKKRKYTNTFQARVMRKA